MVKGMEDRLFNSIIYIILGSVAIVALFPLLYVFAVSITPYGEVLKNGGYIVIPRGFTLEAYRQLLSQAAIPRAFGVTMFITVIGTIVNLLLTILMHIL